MSAAQYARLVPRKYRHRTLPKMDRPIRPRVISWAGPSAFYPNRFYEIDKWYKARIDKPETIPDMHIIEPTDYTKSIREILEKPQTELINIGFKKPELSAKKIEKTEEDRVELERKSRHMELLISIDNLEIPNLSIYKHFNIFDDLFAQNLTEKPDIKIEKIGNSGGFNTLLMVNIDGNGFLEQKNGEFVQYLVANIENGGEIGTGDEVFEYLQPLPFYGTGFHRIAFVLFRHSEKLDLAGISGAANLESRILNVSEFYKKNERVLTPSAIRFCQTKYDESVKRKLHELGYKSPLYNYEYLPALKPDQKEYPKKPQPFDLYLDMYRDPKEIEAEVLEKRLNTIGLNDVEAPKWLDTDYNENKKKLPSWLHSKMLDRSGPNRKLYENIEKK
ncbi:unnamed protein product [Caenorhabditis angaria]|uniref:39S ribosomal protein L38, mitochondrial n=1 Tax=Caenorhabditis angaria TaxID=860376 RepID=A0A9P1MWF6_9PELO|nr:unnamed protein product [Caenorhabditis angaria]